MSTSLINKQRPIVITPGDPAGIGPDVLLQYANQHANDFIIAIANKNLLRQRANELNLNLQLINENETTPQQNFLRILDVPMNDVCIVGQPNASHAQYILKTLEIATQGCLDNKFSALVTGPINKGMINDAGISFTGHTEWLAQYTKTPKPIMLLVTNKMKVALATTHLPLREVSNAITAESVEQCIHILNEELQQRFAIPNPKILVCGLNPHAGDNGHLGTEEQQIIIPTLNKLRQKGIDLIGPVAADTAFTSLTLTNYDVVLAMYHDQGLPVIKAQGFGEAVNVTLGLPIIRTSVDHGTAYSLAGSGKADYSSLSAAINLAQQLTRRFYEISGLSGASQ